MGGCLVRYLTCVFAGAWPVEHCTMDYQIPSVATVSMNLVCTIIPMFGLMCRVLFCKVCCLCCVVVCCVRYVFALCAWTLEE